MPHICHPLCTKAPSTQSFPIRTKVVEKRTLRPMLDKLPDETLVSTSILFNISKTIVMSENFKSTVKNFNQHLIIKEIKIKHTDSTYLTDSRIWQITTIRALLQMNTCWNHMYDWSEIKVSRQIWKFLPSVFKHLLGILCAWHCANTRNTILHIWLTL